MLYSNTLRILKKHLENYFLIYFILFVSFIIGNILGAFIFKRLEYDSNILVFTWFHPFLKNIDKFSQIYIFKKVILYNISLLVLIIILGILSWGYIFVPIVMMFLGTTVGFRVSFLVTYIKLKGFLLSVIGIYPQYLLFLISFLGIGSLSMTFSKKSYNMFKNNRSVIKIIRKKEYISLLAFFLIFNLLGVIVEVFCSPILKFILNDII